MIVILGATGSVGGKIADILIQKGEPVRLVSRSSDRLRPKQGAKVTLLAGDIRKPEFLEKVFKDADAVFTLIPPNPTADNFMDYAATVGESIADALTKTKVKYVVNLSSIGAELSRGTGPITGLHAMEEGLKGVRGLNVLNLRCAYFMENLLWNIDLIKSQGVNGDPLRGTVKIPMIATRDIATYAAERLAKRDFKGSTVQYLLGERDISMTEATGIIGRKIDRPNLSYVQFPYEEAEKTMVGIGMSRDMSRNYIEMDRAFNDGLIKPGKRTKENTTTTSLETFCDEVFVPVYMQKKAA